MVVGRLPKPEPTAIWHSSWEFLWRAWDLSWHQGWVLVWELGPFLQQSLRFSIIFPASLDQSNAEQAERILHNNWSCFISCMAKQRGLIFSSVSQALLPNYWKLFFKLCCKGFYNDLSLLSQKFLAAPVTSCRTMRSFQPLSKSYPCTLKQQKLCYMLQQWLDYLH